MPYSTHFRKKMEYEDNRPRNPEPPKKPARRTKSGKTESYLETGLDNERCSSNLQMHQPIFSQTRQSEPVMYKPIQADPDMYQTLKSNPDMNQTVQSESGMYQTVQSESDMYQTVQSESGMYQTVQSESGMYQTTVQSDSGMYQNRFQLVSDNQDDREEEKEDSVLLYNNLESEPRGTIETITSKYQSRSRIQNLQKEIFKYPNLPEDNHLEISELYIGQGKSKIPDLVWKPQTELLVSKQETLKEACSKLKLELDSITSNRRENNGNRSFIEQYEPGYSFYIENKL